jgi:hypothetical protein
MRDEKRIPADNGQFGCNRASDSADIDKTTTSGKKR